MRAFIFAALAWFWLVAPALAQDQFPDPQPPIPPVEPVAPVLRPMQPDPSLPTFDPTDIKFVSPLICLESLTLGLWAVAAAEILALLIRSRMVRAAGSASPERRRALGCIADRTIWIGGGIAIATLAIVLKTHSTAFLVAGGGFAGLLIGRIPVAWHLAALVGGVVAVSALGVFVLALGYVLFGLFLLWIYIAAVSIAYPASDAGEYFNAILLTVVQEALSYWAIPMSAVGIFVCLALSIMRQDGTDKS